MKKKTIWALAMALLALLATGCAAQTNGQTTIVTSFYPMYVLTLNVTDGIDGVTVQNMAEQNVGCLHDYQLQTRDMVTLEGADALVIEGSEAGGHIGPVATSVLAQEFLPALAAEHVVFVAGGIGRGDMIAAYLEMGASGVQLGTRFACATESIAHPAFKQAFFRAKAREDALEKRKALWRGEVVALEARIEEDAAADLVQARHHARTRH